ncbi:N-acetyltransferase family protein [Devosia sp. 2618]|uniref:GNAT family N-acetyltransferase n=1 Tax=Devosia sp. 2618 TaxID=3156454 RepID=UPI003397780F
MTDYQMRPFRWADVPAITAIYNHYVLHSTATFDTELASEHKLAEKFGTMLDLDHPTIVVEGADGSVLGYGYASVFRPRPAYRFTCEETLYLHKDAVGKGLGKVLLGEIITQARAKGFKQMIGVITAENANSVVLHERLGFHKVGYYNALGLKFDRWLDIVHMQLTL